MHITYVLLVITVITALFQKNKKIFYVSILATNSVGFYQGIVHVNGLLFLLIFSLLIYLFFNLKHIYKPIKITLFIAILVLTIGFMLHLIPGFSNVLAINKIKLSQLSCPFSMYLNFDKVMAGLLLYAISPLYAFEKNIDTKSLLQTILSLIACITIICTIAIFSKYIQLNPKVPSIILIWIINNFFFVCFAEEVIFRGFIQKKITILFENYSKSTYFPIFITAIIFGLMHFKGGVTYIMLASLCGIFYGYVFHQTNRILCSTIIHFGLNLSHILLFTYPAAILACS